MGFAFNIAFRPASPAPTPTEKMPLPMSFWSIFGPANHSTIIHSRTFGGNTALVPSSLKDFALSVISPVTTSLSVTPQMRPPTTPGILTSASCGDCALLTRSSTDMMLRPIYATQVSEVPPTPSTSSLPPTRKTPALTAQTSTALGLRLIDSVSEVADVKMKALIEVVNHDLKDLMIALDDLSHVLRRQTKIVMEQSKGKAKAVREHIEFRNNRARRKAKELKTRGDKYLAFAGERLKERTDIAKNRARSLKTRIETSETWRTYRKAHSELTNRLQEKGNKAEGIRKGKHHGYGHSTTRKQKQNKRTGVRMCSRA